MQKEKKNLKYIDKHRLPARIAMLCNSMNNNFIKPISKYWPVRIHE